MALAALAAGADGLLIEVHPEPDRATFRRGAVERLRRLYALLQSLRRLAEPLGRIIN